MGGLWSKVVPRLIFRTKPISQIESTDPPLWWSTCLYTWREKYPIFQLYQIPRTSVALVVLNSKSFVRTFYPYTAERRDVMGNTSPEELEISRGWGFCTPRKFWGCATDICPWDYIKKYCPKGNIPVASEYQEIHLHGAMNIQYFKINTSLIMMREWVSWLAFPNVWYLLVVLKFHSEKQPTSCIAIETFGFLSGTETTLRCQIQTKSLVVAI